MAKSTKTLLGGMTVLSISGIICKVVGVLFSIPLTWIIGADGLAVFQAVFPTYNLLLTISSAGLPVAVSRLVSACLAKDDPKGAKHTFKVAFWMLATLGVLSTLVMIALNPFLVARVGLAESVTGFYVIAPCVAIVCAMSAFRGFMQGQQDMLPTAASQLIEQVGKVFVSLPLAFWGFQKGLQTSMESAAALGAAGALLGITLAEAAALVYMVWLYFHRNTSFNSLPQAADAKVHSGAGTAQHLVRIAVPITIGACIVPLAQFVDSAMLVNRMMDAGLALEKARPLYGLFSGVVIRLINVPTALALSISMSLVPAISAARAAGDKEGMASQASFGIRFAFLVGLPCSIGMSVMAEPIIRFFYQGTLSTENILEAASLLQFSALTVVLFTMVQATTSILQGMGKQKLPMYTLVAGVACKIALNYLLVGTPGIHIHGGPIASIVCYSVSMLPNLYFSIRYTGMKPDWKNWLLLPGLSTAAMGVVVFAMRELLPMNRLLTIVEIGVGVAVYIAVALLSGAVKQSDFAPIVRRLKRRKSK